MNYIYNISSIATTFGALSKMTFLGQKCIHILGMRHKDLAYRPLAATDIEKEIKKKVSTAAAFP